MKRKVVSGIILTSLLIGILASTLDIQPTEANTLADAISSDGVRSPKADRSDPSFQTFSEPPATEWTHPYGGTSVDVAHALVRTSDGGYAIAGYTSSYGAGQGDAWLVKTDANGNTQWSKTYGGAGYDIANALVQTVDGGYALAGYTDSYGAGGVDFWLVKADSSGNLQWSKTYGGTKTDIAHALIQTADGGYALGGMTVSYCIGEADFWLVKTDANGNAQWTHAYGGVVHEEGQSLVQTVDGGYALAGWTNSYGAGADDMWLVKTDSAGNLQWSKTYGGTWYDEAYALARTTDGGYALAGETVASVNSVSNFYLVKTDGNGNTQWDRTYGGPIDNGASALVQTIDGGYALAGHTYPPATIYSDFWLVKTDSIGNQQWNKTCGGADHDTANALVQTVDGGYALAGRTYSYGAGGADFWLVKIAPSNGGPPEDCGWPVLVAPVQISSNGGYSVGDTLTARFRIQNRGSAAIYLDKLLFGGRFNGGTLPGGGFPDFSYSSVTLQINQIYQYEGTLYLADAGYYQFFVAYYIANPTEAEKQLLDPNNWNTCIDLAPGLTDNDRTWSVQVIANPGNLRAVSIEPVQVVWGVDLVQDKLTDFKISYESTFDIPVEADIRLETPGFEPTSYPFKYKFAPGSNSFVISSVSSLSPLFSARTKPEATFRFSIDPGNLIVETDETDNTFPRTDLERRNVVDTRSTSILFVRVHHADEPEADRITEIQAQTYMTDAMLFLESTYPLASLEVAIGLSPNPLVVERGRDWQWALNQLNQRIITGRWPFRSYTYDRVVGVVNRNWAGWNTADLFGRGSGFTILNSRAVMVKNLYDGSVAHEIGHTYGLGDDYLDPTNPNDREEWTRQQQAGAQGMQFCSTGSGYWVSRRRPVVNRPTFMHAGQPNRWVDNTDYNILRRGFETGDPEVILLSGVIFKNGTAELSESLYYVSDGAVDIEAGGIGNYYVALFDDLGNILSRVGFNVTFSVQSEPPKEVDEEYFSFTMEWVNGTRMIQLQDVQGNVLATRTVSINSPLVTIISPNGSEVLVPGTNYTITWSAWDPDGDTLTYNVLISNGIDSMPVPIATVIDQTSFSYDFTNLEGGNQYLIYIIASDGVNVGGDVSDGFFTLSSFTIDVITPPQIVSLESKANYTLYITSYGGFSNPIILNATSSTTDELVFRWINGSAILPVPNGSIEAILEVEVPYATEGGNHTVFLSGTSGNNTEVVIAYLFASSHDLAISRITQFKTVVGQGFSMTVNVTVENQGNFGETFAVSLYGGQTLILKGSTYLSPQNSTTVTLTWNTSGFAKGNYTLSVNATPVSGETDTADNTLVGGWVVVAMVGDVIPDGVIDIYDLILIATHFGHTPPENHPPGSLERTACYNADVNSDGPIDIFDIITIATNYGNTDP